MPSLEIEIIEKIISENKNFKTFIETGTYMGETIFKMEPLFEHLFTIEINKELFEHVVSTYAGNKINFILGDSSDKLNELCSTVETDLIFFLDGHWSCGITGRGKKDCPLYEELSSIVSLFKHRCVIIVDDVRLFGKGPSTGTEICNWEDISIERIQDIVKNRLTSAYFIPSTLAPNDRYLLFLEKL